MNNTVLDVTVTNTTDPVSTAWLELEPGETIGIHLAVDGALLGRWRIYGSCSPSHADPVDITSAFRLPNTGSPYSAPSAVSDIPAQGGQGAQFVQSPLLNIGAFQVVFTPTSGAGGVRVHTNRP